MDSILDTIKKMLGIDAADESFDIDVKININSSLSRLHLLGLEIPTGFRVVDDTQTWEQLLGPPDERMLDIVQSYIYLTARLVFDPPGNSFLVSAIEKQIKEFGWDISLLTEVNDG